jgi:hypothetical protein
MIQDITIKISFASSDERAETVMPAVEIQPPAPLPDVDAEIPPPPRADETAFDADAPPPPPEITDPPLEDIPPVPSLDHASDPSDPPGSRGRRR